MKPNIVIDTVSQRDDTIAYCSLYVTEYQQQYLYIHRLTYYYVCSAYRIPLNLNNYDGLFNVDKR